MKKPNMIEELMESVDKIYKLENGDYFSVKLKEIERDFEIIGSASDDPALQSLAKLTDYFKDTYMDYDGNEKYSLEDIRRFFNKKKGGIVPEKRYEVAQEMGVLLKDEESSYIIDITDTLLKHFLSEASDVKSFMQPMETLNGVIAAFRDILKSGVKSQMFNYIPDGMKLDGYDFYGEWIDEIERGIFTYAMRDPYLMETLLNILKEIEIYIRSYEVPGVVKRWRELNPKINYFDAPYQIMDESRDLYEAIKRREYKVKFSFYPTDEELKLRNQYFADIELFNRKNNLKRTDDEIFVDELIKTLLAVVNHDLVGYMN